MGQDLGSRAREEITNILVRLPHIQIVERSRMDQIIEEMNFSNSAYVDASTAAEFGKKAGADLVIFGSVSNASYSTENQRQFSFTAGTTMVEVGVAEVSMNVQIVDVETNRTIFSQSTTGSTTGDPNKDKVVPIAVSNAVAEMSASLQQQFPIKGYVIKTDQKGKDYFIYLDVGNNLGIDPGRTVVVFGKGETIIHPVTKEVLSSSSGSAVGKAVIIEVQDKFSIAVVNKKDFERIEIAMTFEVVPDKAGKYTEIPGVKSLTNALKGFGLD